MASRKQLAAINFQPGQRRRCVFPGPAETRTPTPIFGASLDRPHSAGSVSKLLLGARKRLAHGPAGIIGTSRNRNMLHPS